MNCPNCKQPMRIVGHSGLTTVFRCLECDITRHEETRETEKNQSESKPEESRSKELDEGSSS